MLSERKAAAADGVERKTFTASIKDAEKGNVEAVVQLLPGA